MSEKRHEKSIDVKGFIKHSKYDTACISNIT